jgi:succinylglutamate desuccinylase
MCVAGIHGNEPAGVHGVLRVSRALAQRSAALKGRFVAFAGNLAALDARRRFIDRDLNRAWTPERLRELKRPDREEVTAEDLEQVELLSEIEAVLSSADGAVFALDLHTTSGPGGVFSAFTDSLPHRAFAQAFPVPMIFGLEELVDGTLLNLMSEHGLIAMTIETGQHDEAEAIDRAEAAVWIALVTSGVLDATDVPELEPSRALLRSASGHLPRALEMRYRHDVEEADGFTMRPGFSNFDAIDKGGALARDRMGEIVALEGGRVLMPLYQEQGDDGFFLVREFSPFWMSVSLVLRRLRMARFAHLLPGVRRIRGDEVVVNKRIARFFARQLFHLLGYRQLEDLGDRLIMRRRPFDEGRYLRTLPRPDSLRASSESD